jgi:hypothetical protein
VLVVQYRYWWGEWCPPARYLTPILPLLAAPLALAVANVRRARFRLTFAILCVLGWAVALAFAVDGRLMYNQPLGQSNLLVALGGRIGADLTRFEPSYILMFLRLDDPTAWLVTQALLTLAWLLALGALAWFAFSPMKIALTLRSKFPIMPTSSPQQE